ncbi:MAG TPA: SMC-Scp complex subunit ScpB [Steroidobacteraceae bacterium]|jgi:segregation and condensation protein B|nr:SMC-Scp complex subunit ScpB [Steroidobacteraceae bacterium]
MSEEEIRNLIEAALLAAGKPLGVGELAQLFDEAERPDGGAVRAALERLNADYGARALEVKETAAGFRLQVRSRYAGVIARLWPERPQRYSRALLETLALIAYRQPITRAEIEAVRGVVVNPNIIKTLLERQWIRVVGHRDLPGRPELLGTTRDFLDYFGLRSLDELPPLTQLRSLGELDPQLQLPVAEADADAEFGADPDPDAGIDPDAEADPEADADADVDVNPGSDGGESDGGPGLDGTELVASAPIAEP